MRIGIVGAGAAGLCSAWLLDEEHEVTVFETADRLGGHAHTVEVERAGERVGIDAGFEFFSVGMFPTFTRLLARLGVPVRQYPLTATFYTTDNRYVCLLPPLRAGRLVWSALRPRQVLDLVQLAYTLHHAGPLMRARDSAVTLNQFLARLPVTRAFKRDFLVPFLLAGWGVAPEAFGTFSAYDVLSYSYWHRPAGLAPYLWTEVVGGTQAYIRAMAQALTHAQVHTASPVISLTRQGAEFQVQTAGGAIHAFDHVIIATNAQAAQQLLAGLEGAEEIRGVLGQIEYFPTTIAVHGDARLMPANRQHWSVVNTRFDGRHSANTVWKGWKSRQPIFRSWVTFEPHPPEPLYALARYEHPKVNAAYFAAQPRLAAIQGRQQLWLAGAYLQDVDCHESAILSAIDIARRLAPNSTRLRALVAGQG
ncbi:MAG: FAD-dependent oxidoreductase [Anaerolineales bacterium]